MSSPIVRKVETDKYTLLLGDCTKILPDMDISGVDLLLTDPPYKFQTEGGGIANHKSLGYLKQIKANKTDIGFDMSMLKRFHSWVCFCGKSQLIELLECVGERRWCLVTWNKTNPVPMVNNNYLPDTEYIVHAYQPGRLFGEYQDRSRFIVMPNETRKFAHPSIKPLPIVMKMMRLGSQGGETVLDPYMGSGTAGAAAMKLGRRFIGIELDEGYFNIAAKRIVRAAGILPKVKAIAKTKPSDLFS